MCSHTLGSSACARDHVLADVLGVRARVADALDPVDGVDIDEQLGEARLRALRAGRARRSRRSGPSSVTSLTPSAATPLHLGHDLGRPAATPRGRAWTARCSTSSAQLQPTEICTHAWNSRSRFIGRWPVKPSNSKKPCAVEAVARQELGELVHLARVRTPRPRTGTARTPGPSATATSSRRSRSPAPGPPP